MREAPCHLQEQESHCLNERGALSPAGAGVLLSERERRPVTCRSIVSTVCGRRAPTGILTECSRSSIAPGTGAHCALVCRLCTALPAIIKTLTQHEKREASERELQPGE